MTLKQDVLLFFAGARIMIHRFFRKAPEPVVWREAKFLCLGVDGAGKSALLRRAADASATLEGLESTNGFSVKSLVIEPDCKAEVWDIGGRQSLRPYWSKYATADTDALIWVVDATAAGRLIEARDALHDLLLHSPRLRTLPMLVLITKADAATAASPSVLVDGLGIDGLQRERLAMGPHHVEVVSAVDGRNISSALQWLTRAAFGELVEADVEVRRT